jgi:hypothetical protein
LLRTNELCVAEFCSTWGIVMSKPNSFRETYLINEDTAYSGANDVHGGDGQLSEGLLHRGRVVWLEHNPQSEEKSTAVPVYAEGIGVILLRAGCLDRA